MGLSPIKWGLSPFGNSPSMSTRGFWYFYLQNALPMLSDSIYKDNFAL